MSREKVTETKAKCDNCGTLRSYGSMMPWPHSGWLEVRVGGDTYDFCSEACLSWWTSQRAMVTK
jgi:hypothetical protein